MKHLVSGLFLAALVAVSAAGPVASETREIIVAGGCFWCVEADFEKVPGVREAISGYTGGTLANPSYKQVSRGGTGHYEAVRILYDDSRVSAEDLYALFFRSIDPTDAGGQFCDRGDSYRTAIFANGPAQKRAAMAAKAQAQAALGQTIVTRVLQASRFWPAEPEHQDYYKGTGLVLTRFGPLKQSSAYKRYRKACGRDARVRALWGSAAAFAGG
ncbi:peptide-methionine (S)-S-oxide reductase MsrA [Yangia mangrovi]|uniref:Peptide methionine sulfoxide reductase MsrA n=1 Tax=Alloyangia mangrovi TaxID=1779329 RepID=A0A2A3JWU5_9RHOB|nr:peptide-methionine (S)-S-oxide reductase MsrA [Alloyangia mangrovi]MCT4369734.1 peptide-methionine (S)-S-oxide reductase MsrA [Alloyangia mangrovi]